MASNPASLARRLVPDRRDRPGRLGQLGRLGRRVPSVRPARVSRLARVSRAVLPVTAVAVVVPLLTGMLPPPPGGGRSAVVHPPAVKAQRPVPVHAVRGRKAKIPAMPLWHRPGVAWPAAGSAVIGLRPAAGATTSPSATPSRSPSPAAPPSATPSRSPSPAAPPSATSSQPASPRSALPRPAGQSLPAAPSPSSATRQAPQVSRAAAPVPGARGRLLAGPTAGSAQAGTLPVWAGPPASGGSSPRLAAPLSIRVSVASRAVTAAAGVKGMVFSLARADGGAGPAPAHVSVSYRGFAAAYGGYYASRLRLVQLPGCALTTPQVPACRRERPLPSADDVRTSRLGADVSLPAAAGAGAGPASPMVVLAAAPS